MSGYRTGRMFKIYVDAAGAGVGTYERLTIGKNPKLGIEWDEAAVEDDATEYKRYLKGLVDAPLEITANLKVGDTLYNALRTAAFSADGYIGVAICTGLIDTVGEQVFEADWLVTGFPLDAPISETVMVPITLKLAANSPFSPTMYDVEAPGP